MSGERPLRAAVSGSFKRHIDAIHKIVDELAASGIAVLSPSDPTIVDSFGEFLFVQSDRRRSIKGIQNRHLAAIANADFLWLVCPDGYVGQSAAMEVGYAVALGTPIYSEGLPNDLTLRQYINVVGSLSAAAADVENSLLTSKKPLGELLLSPKKTLSKARASLERIETHLLDSRSHVGDDPVEAIARDIRRLLALPTVRD